MPQTPQSATWRHSTWTIPKRWCRRAELASVGLALTFRAGAREWLARILAACATCTACTACVSALAACTARSWLTSRGFARWKARSAGCAACLPWPAVACCGLCRHPVLPDLLPRPLAHPPPPPRPTPPTDINCGVRLLRTNLTEAEVGGRVGGGKPDYGAGQVFRTAIPNLQNPESHDPNRHSAGGPGAGAAGSGAV